MNEIQVILECLKAIVAGEGVEEKIAVLEAILAENRYASESEIEILKGAGKKPKGKKAK